MSIAYRFSGAGLPYEGLAKRIGGKAEWTNIVRTAPDVLEAPLHWRKPRRIFVNSMSDLFHKDVPFDYIDRVFAIMALCPQHTFQVLTKRPERMAEYMCCAETQQRIHAVINERHRDANAGLDRHTRWALTQKASAWRPYFSWPLSNVWLGTSCENQETADERIPWLLKTPAAVRFISAEPLLGPIDLHQTQGDRGCDCYIPAQEGAGQHSPSCSIFKFPKGIGWCITGGESGTCARPMHPDWARSLRDQCAGAGVPFFFKQWGEWLPSHAGTRDGDEDGYYKFNMAPDRRDIIHSFGDGWGARRVGKKNAGRLLDGRTWDGFPEPVTA